MKNLLYSTALLLRSQNPAGVCLEDFSTGARAKAGRYIITQLIDKGHSYEASALLSCAAEELRMSTEADDAVRLLSERDIAFSDYLLSELTYCFFKREGDLRDVLSDIDRESRNRVIRGVAVYQMNGGGV